MEEKILNIASHRHTQMLNFWQCMEGIRWRFTSTFGIGAIVALFLSVDQVDNEKSLVALIVLFCLSIASIICQLRVYGVLTSMWRKMIILQRLELERLKETGQFPSISLEDEIAFYFPQPISPKIRLFSVTGVSCSAFGLLSTLAIYLSMRLFSLPILWSTLAAGIFLLICLTLVSSLLSKSVEISHQSKPAKVKFIF